MKRRPYFPLLAKVLLWLLLHLTIVALAFFGFMGWQLRLGLDSLLTGAAGDRLRAFGESARMVIVDLPRSEWNESIKPLADEKGVVAGFFNRSDPADFPLRIPGNVLERLRTVGPPRPASPDRRDLPGPPGEGFGPRGPRERPEDRGPLFHEPNRSGAMPPVARPAFLVRGDGGDGYWAAVEILANRLPGQPGRPEFLLIRSDRMDGSGMFFEIRPWLLGGMAVLLLSLAFWTPLVWGITRYINRLRLATEHIAAGQFRISIPSRGNDELGNLGRAVETMAARLDHLVMGQKRFMGDAAHELCAPLARLRTGIGILEMVLTERDLPRLAQIEEDARELATLVEEILAFSRAENRASVLKTLLLEPLVDEVISRESPQCEVAIQVPGNLTVVGDPGLLQRALGNLVRNIQVHAGASAKGMIRAEELGDWVEITVSDDGPGVPPEELPRLFEPFYRPDRSRSRETGGSGLGMAIVRTVVESSGGEVSAFLRETGGFGVKIRLRRTV